MDTSSLTLTQILAVWGALLSTFLAGVKFWELWNNRLKIDVSAIWIEYEDIGNTVIIRNLSSFSIMLTGWELFYRQRAFLIPQDEQIESNDFDWADVTINPISAFSLNFCGQDHFSTRKTLDGSSIYIKLYFAGYKTITRKIYKA